MRFGPPVGFARRPDGRRIAYQVVGDGDLDLVFLPGYASHLGLQWVEPSVAGFLDKLAAFSRLILLDRLGSGLSDRGPSGQSFEDDLDDVALVLDTIGSERTAFFGTHLGGRLALLFAATYPERTKAVVTFASHPASMRDEDFPWGSSEEDREQLLASLRDGSYDPTRLLARMAPREVTDPAFMAWWRMYSLSAMTAPEAYDTVMALGSVDIRRLLGSIRVPTLLLHRSGDQFVDVHTSRYMAERIPGARLVELPGDDHLPFFGGQDAVVALTQEFLTGAQPTDRGSSPARYPPGRQPRVDCHHRPLPDGSLPFGATRRRPSYPHQVKGRSSGILMRRPVIDSGRTRTYRAFSPGAQGYRGRARSRSRGAGSVISARVPRTTTLQPVRVGSSVASTSKATDSRSVAASSSDPGSVRKMTRSWSNT